MGLEYRYTCSEIDEHIKDAKGVIDGHIDKILSEACPLLEDASRRKSVEEYEKELYEELSPVFEGARSANEQIRNAADKQIEALQEEVKDLDEELTRTRDMYEETVEELKEELSNLREVNTGLKTLLNLYLFNEY